jgi:quinol-cytochrome oxidoreductase complex cytochrome b subunit
MSQKPINYSHLSTLVAVAILVGTELVGASWAAGWALGGLFQLDPMISHVIEVFFALLGLVGLYFFMRTAIRNEPIRG